MFRFFSYSFLSLLLLLIFSLPHSFPARKILPLTELTASQNSTWLNFAKFLDAGKGANLTGMAELKRYFHRFGYLGKNSSYSFTDLFDDSLESAVINYQRNLGLSVSGKLDSDTVTQIMSPRCGMSDAAIRINHKKLHKVGRSHNTGLHTTRKYAYFYGQPRWAKQSPMTLTYSFTSGQIIDYIDFADIQSVFQRAFARWSSVIPVNFTEVPDGQPSDIKIGFYSHDHGDGEPFDGVLGILAHAFSPENGRFHLDDAETWAVDFKAQKSKVAVDLESVATHEIGHILGLAHTSVKEAVMYPSLSPRTIKVDLKVDDVEGIQELYGSNPNFKYSSLLESDISSGWVVGVQNWSSMLVSCLVFFFLFLCLSC